MTKRKMLFALSFAALFGLISTSFADNSSCPSDISAATAACLDQAATQQFVTNFNNYFSTAQSMSQFSNNQNTMQQNAPQTAQNNNAEMKNEAVPDTKSYVAPVISNPDSNDKQKINWF